MGRTVKPANRQTGSSDPDRDALYRALPPGKRISASGKVYYEYRRNRSDLAPDEWSRAGERRTARKKEEKRGPGRKTEARKPSTRRVTLTVGYGIRYYGLYGGKWLPLIRLAEMGVVKEEGKVRWVDRNRGEKDVVLPADMPLVKLESRKKKTIPSLLLPSGEEIAGEYKEKRKRRFKPGEAFPLTMIGYVFEAGEKKYFFPLGVYGRAGRHFIKMAEAEGDLEKALRIGQRQIMGKIKYRRVMSRLHWKTIKLMTGKKEKAFIIAYGATYPHRRELRQLGMVFTRNPIGDILKSIHRAGAISLLEAKKEIEKKMGRLGFYITQGAYIKEVKNKNELKTIIEGLKRIIS